MANLKPARNWLRREQATGLHGRAPHARGALGFSTAALIGLAACGTSSIPVAQPTPNASSTGIQIAPELLGPLTMLGPCSEVVDPGMDQHVPGLRLPPEAFLLEVTEQHGLVNVRGYAAMTPIVLQLWLRERDDLEMITVENEIQESETLYSDGERRVFFKAAAVCELGSVFIAAIAADADAEKVPTPSGSPSGQ